MNNKLLRFDSFINESSSVLKGTIPSIKERWDGGYDIKVCDSVLNGGRMDDSYINISKKTEKAVALAYIQPDGKTSTKTPCPYQPAVAQTYTTVAKGPTSPTLWRTSSD